MSQTRLPPLERQESRSSAAVAAPPRPGSDILSADRPPSQPWWARAIKWPIHQLLKGIYLGAVAAKQNRVTALIIVLLLAGLLGSGAIVYGATHPTTPATTQSGRTPTTSPAPGTQGNTSGAPLVPYLTAQPSPLPSCVEHWMHGHQTFNGHELWTCMDAQAQQAYTQQGLDENGLSQRMAQYKSAGVVYQQFIYTGGFVLPDGSGNYEVEVIMAQGGASQVLRWVFQTDTQGLIAQAYSASSAPQG